MTHGDSWVGSSLLRAALKVPRSIPTERGIFAAEADTASKAIALTAPKKIEPWHFAVLQVNQKLDGNALIPFPSHRLISVFKCTLTPKCFGAPAVWETHPRVVWARRKV